MLFGLPTGFKFQQIIKQGNHVTWIGPQSNLLEDAFNDSNFKLFWQRGLAQTGVDFGYRLTV